MEIEEAFTQEAVDEMDDGSTSELLAAIVKVARDNNIELTSHGELLNFAGFCFVAGRAYQAAQPLTVTVEMTLEEYVNYLKGAIDERSA